MGSKQQINALVAEYLAHRHPDVMEQILERMKPSVVTLARKLSGVPALQAQDLIQEGLIEVVNAVGDFDPVAYPDVLFSSFAYNRVRGAMQHYIRDKHHVIRQPAKIQEIRFKLRGTVIPTTESERNALIRRMGITPAVFEAATAAAPTTCNYESAVNGHGAAYQPEVVKFTSYDPRASMELRILLHQVVNQLDPRHQTVLKLHIEGNTNKEIARYFGFVDSYGTILLTNAVQAAREVWNNLEIDEEDNA